MWSFLTDLLDDPEATKTVVVMDAREAGSARRHHLRPRRLIGAWAATLAGAGLVVALLIVFTPLRTMIPGYNPDRMRKRALQNAKRVQALQDSIATQRRYVRHIRQLVTGGMDSVTQRPTPQSQPSPEGRGLVQSPLAETLPDTAGTNRDGQLAAVRRSGGTPRGQGRSVLGVSVPVRPPVDKGFPTRGFDAETAHFGIDIAVPEGSYVRAIGPGRVVLADWTRDGGNTVVVQHGDGYLSVYKHNKKLLKRLGDRVQAQEPLAVSGNTGEITTGPHLHFELWHDGLAQDPASYVAGW